MTLKDFLKCNTDVDFESYFTDDWAMAYVGPTALTEEGETRFAAILDKDVNFIDKDHAQLMVNTDEEDELARKFFRCAAGYCTCETYDELFKED